MNDHAIVLHHVPGRMRLRVPAAKGDADKLNQLRQRLSSLSGVRQITVNPGIATMIIDYDAALFAEFVEQLRELLTIEGALVSNFQVHESAANRSIERVAESASQRVQALTGNLINLKEVFPFSVVLYAIFFVDRAVNASQWLNWIQFAFSSYLDLHQNEPIGKIGAGVETLRAEMAALHAENLKALTAQIANLEGAVRDLSRQLGNAG